jgi:hypothetical protein
MKIKSHPTPKRWFLIFPSRKSLQRSFDVLEKAKRWPNGFIADHSESSNFNLNPFRSQSL